MRRAVQEPLSGRGGFDTSSAVESLFTWLGLRPDAMIHHDCLT